MEPKQSVHAGPPAPPAASPKEAKVNLYTFGYPEWSCIDKCTLEDEREGEDVDEDRTTEEVA